MWYIMENVQQTYSLSERLIRAICNWYSTFDRNGDDIEDLINRGADVNGFHGGLLPLQCAAMVSDDYCLRLLIQKGAKVNDADSYGRMAIHYAAERDVLCLEILLRNDADINARDSNQDTPLHWAAFKNNAACVKLLLQYGADVNSSDFNNDTPLSWAAHKGNLEATRILLDYNASVNIRNYHGHTPLLRAAAIIANGLNSDDDDACLQLLVRSSGSLDLTDGDGQPLTMITNDNKLSEMLLPFCHSPQKLSSLCRYQIRASIGRQYLPNIIPKLPVPNILRAFLLLKS